MRHTVRWLVAGSVFAAACGEGNTPTAPQTSGGDVAISPMVAAPGEAGAGNEHIHILVPHSNAWDAQAAKPARPNSGTGISWHGGPVMHAVNVAALYWGASAPMYPGGPSAGATGSGSGDNSLIGKYLNNVGGSSYWTINTDYYDGSAHVPLAVSYTQFYADNVNSTSSATSDAGIQNEIKAAIAAGKLTYNANTLYAVFTGPGVNLGGGFGTQYCAYHGRFSSIYGTIIYSAQPYNDHVSNCSWQNTGPNGIDGDATVNTLAHELEEAATDPMLNAWYDNRGYENADKCAWTFGTTSTAPNGALYNMTIGGTKFLIQRNWLNRGSGGCSTGI